MRSIDLVVETKLERTARVKQLSGMFDVPAQEKLSHHWQGEIPIDERDWNVGLIVGPSGAGKSSVSRQLFGEEKKFDWAARSVIDDFGKQYPIAAIAEICSAVGFNTIPSWMKPHAVLSTGEKFRVELARHLLEGGDLIMIDEFTSVIDRQVAHIGCHAVQKHVRKHGKKFVAVTCHYDVVDWLQPDWMLEPATMSFQWRSLQRRPDLNVEIARVDRSAWKLFAPFHYLTADLHKAAACFVLFVEGMPASFAGVLHRPHARVNDIKGVSRLVTLPDYQGLGLAMILADALGAAYKAQGYRLHTYPAHPSLVRSFDKSRAWALHKKPGQFSPAVSTTSAMQHMAMGSRPCAVFEFCGPRADDAAEALALIEGNAKPPLRLHVEQRLLARTGFERQALGVAQDEAERPVETNVVRLCHHVDELDLADDAAEQKLDVIEPRAEPARDALHVLGVGVPAQGCVDQQRAAMACRPRPVFDALEPCHDQVRVGLAYAECFHVAFQRVFPIEWRRAADHVPSAERVYAPALTCPPSSTAGQGRRAALRRIRRP
jgi:GNAT superfamily N-acetyltransferase